MSTTNDTYASEGVTNSTYSSQYRQEIDGLRALAVIAVIVSHFDLNFLPLGHLGVDIFFVISGYVITSSIYYRESSKKLLVFWRDFFARRFKRLFPALALCVLVTSLLLCLFDPSPEGSLRTGLASLFGVSNLYLIKQATDYFGVWSKLNAFTHTWSLSVEEQFYLFFPFLVWATGLLDKTTHSVRYLISALCVLSAISLASYLILTEISQPMAFFLVTSRFWELGAGALVFLLTRRHSFALGLLKSVPSSPLLLALILVLVVDVGANHISTISCVALTCLLIANISQGSLAYRMFTLGPITYLGKISYSLYLWHWSVICLSRWTVGLSWELIPLQFAAMLGLAALSYHFVERPLRHHEWSRFRMVPVAYGAGSALLIASVLVVLDGPGNKLLFAGTANSSSSEAASVQPSDADQGGKLILVGDSHGRDKTPMISAVSERLALDYTTVNAGATIFPKMQYSSPAGGLTRQKVESNTDEMAARVAAALADMETATDKVAVLSFFYRFYFEAPLGNRKNNVVSHFDGSGTRISADAAFEEWLTSVRTFAGANPNLSVVVLLSTPEMPYLYPEAICQEQWFRPRLAEQCFAEYDRDEMIAILERLNAGIRRLTSEAPNIFAFDPVPILCPASDAVCRSHIQGVRIFSDEDHLTPHGAMLMTESFADYLVDQGIVAPGTSQGNVGSETHTRAH
ncbi:MAG: acyltransferase family protein [Pseudomonadota bacterium]